MCVCVCVCVSTFTKSQQNIHSSVYLKRFVGKSYFSELFFTRVLDQIVQVFAEHIHPNLQSKVSNVKANLGAVSQHLFFP